MSFLRRQESLDSSASPPRSPGRLVHPAGRAKGSPDSRLRGNDEWGEVLELSGSIFSTGHATRINGLEFRHIRDVY